MKTNRLALWAGLSAFFSTILAIGAINILNPDDRIRLVGGVFVGLVTGATIYSRQQMDDARTRRAKEAAGHVEGGEIKITNRGDKRVYTLELKGDPRNLEDKQEVLFKVNKIDEKPRE